VILYQMLTGELPYRGDGPPRAAAETLQVPEALSSWALKKQLGVSVVFWTGAALTIVMVMTRGVDWYHLSEVEKEGF
jgi:hypothetical protein